MLRKIRVDNPTKMPYQFKGHYILENSVNVVIKYELFLTIVSIIDFNS